MRPPVPTHPDDDRLLELAYGEAPASLAPALRQHVDGCARCRTVLDGIAEVRSAFRSVPTEPAPRRGLDSLLAYAEQAAARARSRRGGLRILGILSAAAALAVVWLVLPPQQTRPAESVARAPASGAPDVLARADVPQAPAQGSRARDEADREKALKAPAAPQPVREEQPAPARRAATEPEAKQKGLAKLDAPADRRPSASPPELRADDAAKDRAAARSNVSGLLGGAGVSIDRTAAQAGPSSGAGAGMVAGGDAFAAKKGTASSRAPAPAVGAPASAEDVRAQDAAAVAAAPLNEALAKSERGRASATAEPASPTGALPPSSSGKKDGAAAPAAPASKVVPMQSMRVGSGSPEKQARLAEIRRQLETAKGDPRKALLMERCEIEASLELRPDVVLSCSNVGREFPGTPEAKRAAEIARGFSVQLPAETPER
ncbi:MAG TPA: hypothetical protein VLT82_15630 [Myxococcaceae bacterium]|nr:hypothetical protein [Myxococcaceae bacterium]